MGSQVAAFGVVTAPVWLTALLLGRAWMFLRQRWRQEADAEVDGFLLPPDLQPGAQSYVYKRKKAWFIIALIY